MSVAVAVLIGGAVVAVAGIAVYMRATRQKPAAVDPIASTTGSNRTLTGTRPPAIAGDSIGTRRCAASSPTRSMTRRARR